MTAHRLSGAELERVMAYVLEDCGSTLFDQLMGHIEALENESFEMGAELERDEPEYTTDPDVCHACHKLWEICKCSKRAAKAMEMLDLVVAGLTGHGTNCSCSECERIRQG